MQCESKRRRLWGWKPDYTKCFELTLVDFPATLSDLEEQWRAWCWRQHVLIKMGREWMPEIWIWDPSFLPGELCGHCNLAKNTLALYSVSCLLSLKRAHQSVSSVAQLCPTFCNPMDCSMPGLPVHHQLPEFTQTHVHWVNDAIQLSHPLSSASPPAFSLSQGLFQWVTLHQVAKVLELQLQHQSFQWTFKTDFL